MLNLKFPIQKLIFILLPIVYLLLLLTQQDKAFTQDLGRHIKTGEIIVKCLCVPKTNLFSFTEPNHAFINHHWLSEVIFYLFYTYLGAFSIIVLKVFLIMLAFGIVYYLTIKMAGWFWANIIAIPYLFIFSERFDARPEIFSSLFIAIFIFLIQKYRKTGSLKFLFPLPIIELFWVNIHIYFIVGIVLVGFLLVEEILTKKLTKQLIILFFITAIATLFNPNGISGALQPFIILQNYGYSIVENQNIFFLNAFFFNTRILMFEIVAIVFILLSLFAIKKKDMFFILISIFAIVLAFKVIRNFPIFVLTTLPYFAVLASRVEERFQKTLKSQLVKSIAVVATGIFLVFDVYRITTSPIFGFSYVRGTEVAVDFFEKEKLKGPIFNNFDIGSYLIFRLYPKEKIFVDGRPEAYSIKFFDEYKNMQQDPKFFAEQSKRYHLNTIFFAHTDITPWAQQFLHDIVKNKNWVPVYLDERVIIFVKNSSLNKDIINKFRINDLSLIR